MRKCFQINSQVSLNNSRLRILQAAHEFKKKKNERTHSLGQTTYTNLVPHIIFSNFIPASSIRKSIKYSSSKNYGVMKTSVICFPHGLQINRGEMIEENNHMVTQLNYQLSISPTSVTKNP